MFAVPGAPSDLLLLELSDQQAQSLGSLEDEPAQMCAITPLRSPTMVVFFRWTKPIYDIKIAENRYSNTGYHSGSVSLEIP